MLIMSNSNIESFLELYQSPKMKIQYRNALRVFFEWIKKTPEQIVEEYKSSEDKNQFLKQYGILLCMHACNNPERTQVCREMES